eukprot:6491641-Amphidinium_carterae.3
MSRLGCHVHGAISLDGCCDKLRGLATELAKQLYIREGNAVRLFEEIHFVMRKSMACRGAT